MCRCKKQYTGLCMFVCLLLLWSWQVVHSGYDPSAWCLVRECVHVCVSVCVLVIAWEGSRGGSVACWRAQWHCSRYLQPLSLTNPKQQVHTTLCENTQQAFDHGKKKRRQKTTNNITTIKLKGSYTKRKTHKGALIVLHYTRR